MGKVAEEVMLFIPTLFIPLLEVTEPDRPLTWEVVVQYPAPLRFAFLCSFNSLRWSLRIIEEEDSCDGFDDCCDCTNCKVLGDAAKSRFSNRLDNCCASDVCFKRREECFLVEDVLELEPFFLDLEDEGDCFKGLERRKFRM